MNTKQTEVPDSLPLDDRLSLLSSHYRRYLLYGLSQYTTPVSLAVLTDTVTEFEHGTPVEQYRDERLKIYTALYHNHLPRLVDAGVVQYNQSEDLVDIGPNAPALVPLLESTIEHDLSASGNGMSPSTVDIDSLQSAQRN
ncbi:hypothetical protein SAMN05443574_101545 [Haloarcula vallismortis]|uniref:DUF7344 domain-containing protein n=2 Tax=Haloarcula vallismortis TaxID=28442 RepID=M0IW87_HALVA|nr:hypothetical protein [Haloarcula vallismortis]EMA01112.1 hypothetical protein C437_19997 [Haloarcula vallismortis ATCC 29715]SDW15557.1 hypothetical protein SAMN05443574_101545 [Haloarcula vallismortis]